MSVLFDWMTPELGRWVNVVLATGCVVAMLTRFRWWLGLERWRRFHWASSFLFCAATLYGTLELLLHLGQVLRVAMFTFALLWTLFALVLAPAAKRRQTRPGEDERV